MNDRDGESAAVPSSSEQLLAGLPPPKNYPLLRTVFALVFGTGVQWKGVYFVNILLDLVVLAGFGGVAFVPVDFITSTDHHGSDDKALSTSDRDRARVARTLVFLYKLSLSAVCLAAFTYASVHIHNRRNAYSLLNPGFPCPLARQQASSSPSTRRVGTWLVNCITGVVTVCTLCYAIAVSAGLHAWKVKVGFTETIPLCLELILYTWGPPAVMTTVTVFYAQTDDVVLVISSTAERLCALASTSTEGCPGSVQRSTGLEARQLVSSVRELQLYVDSTLATAKKWFVVHMTLLFLTIVSWIFANFLLVLAGGREDISIRWDNPSNLIQIILLLMIFLLPLHAAARVTIAWNQLITSVCTSPEWIELGERQYQTAVLFLDHSKGGFRVFDSAVAHKSGLQVFAILVALAGLARYA